MEGNDLFGIPILGLTAPGVILFIVLLLATGRIVPRKTMEDAIHDRDMWRAAHMTSESARMMQSKQIDELLETTKTTKAIMESLASSRPGNGER